MLPVREATPSDARDAQPSLIVAVGASAGGLEAFTQILDALPATPNAAFIFLQHLSPQHDSALPLLLTPHTTLPVVQAASGMTIEVDHLYVMPPNVQMEVKKVSFCEDSRPACPSTASSSKTGESKDQVSS